MVVKFLDVGSHNGQTLEEVIKPKYGFSKIYGFEPMPEQYSYIKRHYNHPNIELFNYGLLDKTEKRFLYGSNKNMEASIYPNGRNVNRNITTECIFVEASEFFRKYLLYNDINIVKLNCEGSEVAILNNLIDTGEIWKITNVMITFDISKISGMEHHEQLIISRFRNINFNKYFLCNDVMRGATHQDRIANWLARVNF